MENNSKKRAALIRWSKYEKTYSYCKFCGNRFAVPPSVIKKGKGKFCSRSCSNRSTKGGEFIIKQNGYKYLKDYKHPNRSKQNLIAEHRKIVEDKLGRLLRPEEVIHHIDENKLNNNYKNLFLCKDDIEHRQVHEINKDFLKMFNIARYEHKEFFDFDITKNRQDQLQEMTSELYGWGVFDSLCDKMNRGKLSKEQCGLIVVMKEKFNKVWDGENWIVK